MTVLEKKTGKTRGQMKTRNNPAHSTVKIKLQGKNPAKTDVKNFQSVK